ELKLFRDSHVRMVSLYIINQACKGPSIAHGGFAIAHGEEASKQNIATPTPPPDDAQTVTPAPPDSPAIKEGSNTCITDRPLSVAHVNNILYPQTVLTTLPSCGLARLHDPNSRVFRGTGGTNLIPFLKQTRDETAEAKIVVSEVGKAANKERGEKAAREWGR